MHGLEKPTSLMSYNYNTKRTDADENIQVLEFQRCKHLIEIFALMNQVELIESST